jgi:hypothetical protein
MKWTPLRIPKVDRGHKFFRDQDTGRVAIADWSGDYPHQTDDGVLWLDLGARSITFDAYKTIAFIPLLDNEGRQTSTIADLEEAKWVTNNFGAAA